MLSVWKSDLYRLTKSKLLYGIMSFTGVLAGLLVTLIHRDIRLGISVFGDLTAFTRISDIVRIGIEYHKGFGILAAVLISVFIGQEYQWKTWQHKSILCKNRVYIYLSKAAISAAVSASIFLLFEIIVLLCSGQIRHMLTSGCGTMLLCGAFIYAALGSVLCFLSMLIRNSTAAAIVCLCYVLFCETFISAMQHINLSDTAARLIAWGIRHSVYGMSALAYETPLPADRIPQIVVNAMVIMIISTGIGAAVFRRYEL